MKTLYININNEQIQSSEELEVLKYDLDNDFFFYIGEKIAKGCNVDNRIHLITEFNTTDNQKDYQQITSQWNEVKGILFSEECACEFKVSLPDKYIHWLKFHPQYVEMYDKNFSHGESNVISIDLEELYEESIEDMQREILRKLKRDDLHKEIDEIVFNDDGVSRNSPNVCIITEKYKNIKFKSCKKYKLREFCTFDDDVLKNKEQNDGTLDIAPEISIEKRIEIAKSFPLDWQLLFYRISFLRTSDFSDGLASIKLNNKYGFIDKTGKSVIPCIYDRAGSFSEGLAYVYLNNKWGFFDKTGELVIPCIYDEADSFSEGLAPVKLNNKWGVIDKTGNMVVSCAFDDRTSIIIFKILNLIRIEVENEYLFYDLNGKFLTLSKL